jgi:hypothetical protein
LFFFLVLFIFFSPEMMLQNALSRLSSRREVVVMGVVKLLRPLSTQPVAEQSSAQLYRTSVNTVRFVSQ